MRRRNRILPAVQRLALRTARTPLARVWMLGYRALRWVAALWLTGGRRDAAVYERAGMGGSDFLPGLSDIDIAVVVASDRAAAERRWERAQRALPSVSRLVDWPLIFEEGDLAGVVGHCALTYAGGAAFSGSAAAEGRARMLYRPGVYGDASGWRLLRGPERRPPAPASDDQERRIAGWLELAQWWLWAFDACIDPSGPYTANLCLKLVSEPARVWLWLAHGERPRGRAEVLERARTLLPEEEPALRAALELRRALPISPAPPLRDTLPTLVRLTARIAALMGDQVRAAGTTAVRLTRTEPVLPRAGWEPGGDLLALCDWRALALPGLPDETFVVVPGHPGDPAVLGATARAQRIGTYPALRAHDLLVMPSASHARSRLRAVQCGLTDPVSFALLAGSAVAQFPNVRGWSAADCARRAIAEQRAAVIAATEPGRELAALLTAARAALFLESIEEGDPELAVTIEAAARRLAERAPVAKDAFGHYRLYARDRTQPPADVVAALRDVVMQALSCRSHPTPTHSTR